MPPAELVYLVTGQFDIEAFNRNGVVGATCIQQILRSNGLSLKQFENILDFGCGCGRVMRQWQGLAGPCLYGVDYNPRLVHWCQRNLKFAQFRVNRSGTPLEFPEKTFDFIYCISVFTHLREADQEFWMRELVRVLKPGGYLIFTVHGTTRLYQLAEEQRCAFDAGQVVIACGGYSGRNFCATYHPESYVRKVLCPDLTCTAFVPGGAKDANQDAFLMQKPV